MTWINKNEKKNFFAKIFYIFDPIFDGRPIFKGMKHVTRGIARVESGIKLFVGPGPSILAIIDTLGLES